MENYKDNIIATRVGCLGSSDARMVAKVGRTGKLSYADKERLAVLTGQAQPHDFSNAATRNGDYIEQEIYKDLKAKFPGAQSNPAFASILYQTPNFFMINHIDIEVIQDDDYLVWYEVKASKYSTPQVLKEYDDQLRWHYMLLREKANLLKLRPVLILVHYQVEDYGATYDPSRVQMRSISFKGDYADDIKKGLEIIDQTLEAGFKWEPREELDATELPAEMQDKLTYITNRLREAAAIQAEVEAFKGGLLEACLSRGIKSIKAEGWSAIVKDGYVSQRLNSSKLKADHPDIYEQYLSQSNIKPSITLKVN